MYIFIPIQKTFVMFIRVYRNPKTLETLDDFLLVQV